MAPCPGPSDSLHARSTSPRGRRRRASTFNQTIAAGRASGGLHRAHPSLRAEGPSAGSSRRGGGLSSPLRQSWEYRDALGVSYAWADSTVRGGGVYSIRS
ncbi:MAG TPA: hypothetical protein VER55_08865 [Ardenticatenaceae bacterium]|nr:hypothetical protein [Ardenticatenaceae bacterium]